MVFFSNQISIFYISFIYGMYNSIQFNSVEDKLTTIYVHINQIKIYASIFLREPTEYTSTDVFAFNLSIRIHSPNDKSYGTVHCIIYCKINLYN